jgi:hypothetical protein
MTNQNVKDSQVWHQLFFISFVLLGLPFFFPPKNTALKPALNQTFEAQDNDSIGFISRISLDKRERIR